MVKKIVCKNVDYLQQNRNKYKNNEQQSYCKGTSAVLCVRVTSVSFKLKNKTRVRVRVRVRKIIEIGLEMIEKLTRDNETEINILELTHGRIIGT